MLTFHICLNEQGKWHLPKPKVSQELLSTLTCEFCLGCSTSTVLLHLMVCSTIDFLETFVGLNEQEYATSAFANVIETCALNVTGITGDCIPDECTEMLGDFEVRFSLFVYDIIVVLICFGH